MKTAESKTTNPSRAAAQPHFSTQDDHHAEASFFLPVPVQAKLEIGQPNDQYEQEADEMADRIVRGDSTQSIGADASPKLQMKCAACEEEQGMASVKEPQGDIQTKPLLMRKAQNGASVGTPALASQLNSSKGGGQSLPDSTNQQMSHSFGTDFSGVRIHTDSRAAEMNQGLSARAFTHGSDVYFNQGEYSPGSSEGKKLLAHELTHVVQQGGVNTIRRFGSEEHRQLGNSVVPGNTLITSYGTLSFGEIVALAGDYFESVQEISSLAASGRDGRDQIDFARWKVNSSLPRPTVSQSVEDAVMSRYYRLAARNETHFSTGSSPGRNNREQYIRIHTESLREAYLQGQFPLVTRPYTWDVQEGFAQHFLSDAFSAGHIRTRRGEIQRHWNGMYASFTDNFVTMVACYMASHINARDNIGNVTTVDFLTSQIEPIIRQKAGTILSAFSIGDLISKVLHDADNQGLDVVSQSGINQSNFRWRSVGDDRLFTSGGTAATTAQINTQQMTTHAMRLSYEEGQQAWRAGTQSNHSALLVLLNPANFRALPLIPSENTQSVNNQTYAWQATNIQALPFNIRTLLVAAFAPGTEIRTELDGLSIDCITPVEIFDVEIFNLHTRDAFNCFKQKLLANVWQTLVEITIGGASLCPPSQNDYCPTLRNGCP